MSDHYETLGVSRDAGEAEIKKAYRKLALELHPDRTGGDHAATERLKAVNEAYSVLSDPDKRVAYDHGDDPFGGGIPFDIQEQIESFFGGRRRRAGPPRGRDVVVELTVSLAEAFTGCTKDIALSYDEPCSTCEGTGDDKASQHTPCTACRGSGVAQVRQGFIVFQATCPACSGRGGSYATRCKTCTGTGSRHTDRSIPLEVPAGVNTGDNINLQGHGAWGPGGVGNAHVIINVQPDKHLRRDGADLIAVVDLTIVEATLGTVKSIRLPDGTQETFEFKAGTQPGSKVAHVGAGMPVLNGRGRGALRTIANVVVPTELTPEQVELLRMLERTLT